MMFPWQLILRLPFPLTIISMGTITKWWHVLPVDAPDTMMSGFPFAFISDGWHTSMSLQVFVLELVLDFLAHFLFWTIAFLFFDLFVMHVVVSKLLTGILWTSSVLFLTFAIWAATFTELEFKTKRDWDMQVLETGFKFTFQHKDRPDISK